MKSARPHNTVTEAQNLAQKLTMRANLALWYETFMPVIALALAMILLFFALAAAGLWQRIGDPWRGLFGVASLALIIRSIIALRKIKRPNKSAARRRAEAGSDLSHRPIDTVYDNPAALSQAAEDTHSTWGAHRNNAAQTLKSAKHIRLKPVLAPIDRYYLRFLVPLALITGIMFGFGDTYERMRRASLPIWMSGMSANMAEYEAWVDPPTYTRRPPSYFKTKSTLSAPEGSVFVARIQGLKTPPRLIVRTGNKRRRLTPSRLGPESFEVRTELETSASASFRIGSSEKTWTVNVGEDTHPDVEFVDPPKAGKRDRLIFSYSLKDDFGVTGLSLVMKLTEPDEYAGNAASETLASETLAIALPGRSVREAENEPASLDLTEHKWAGKMVTGYLAAVDGNAQIGTSSAVDFVVPDKVFTEQLAKAIAEQRSLLLANTQPYAPRKPLPQVGLDDFETRPLFYGQEDRYTIARAPQNVQRAALLIDAITDQPVNVYGDPAVYMGLRNVYRRLQSAQSRDGLGGIPEDLWSIALRAEFGRLGDALADMQAAERALNNAMARRAPQREIDALFDRYNAAVDRYMEELTLKAIEEAKNRQQQDGEGGAGGADMATDEIQELLDAIEEANRMGDTAAARRALAQLAELLENMRIELAQGGSGGSGSPLGEGMSEEVQDALEELNEILGDQRQLRDETQSAERDQMANESAELGGQPAPGPAPDAQGLAGSQSGLSEMLDALDEAVQDGVLSGENEAGGGAEQDEEATQDGLGGGLDEDMSAGIEEALRGAREAMRESEDALRRGDFDGAGSAQTRAIEALREAGEGLIGAEAARLAKDGEGNQQQSGAENDRDPFGRENDGSGVGDDVDIPQIDERQRARDLLEELRRRSGEPNREDSEKNYLRRLLDRF